jgi:L-lactate utilization protein LutC
MNSKDKILDRLRKAPGFERRPAFEAVPYNTLFCQGRLTKEALYEHFKTAFLELIGELHEVVGEQQAAEKLFELVSKEKGSLLCQDHPLLARLADLNAGLKQRLRSAVDLGSNAEECAQAVAGISVADALMGRTGSIMLRSITAGGRRLSVLSPYHIVVATKDQIVPAFHPWLEQISEDDSWSMATIISGPSRTADIEKILVFGAHGPKRLALILIG